MTVMRLCAGSLEIADPERLVTDYLDPALGCAWPAYDELVTNGEAVLVDGDLLAPTLIGVHLDRVRFGVLREMMPRLQGVASLPPMSLQDADDDAIAAVANLYSVLDEAPYRGRGVRGTILSKVLHRKRPDLVPLYDSVIFEAYTASAIPRLAERNWVEFMTLLCGAMRQDLHVEADRFAALSGRAAAAGANLTPLRLLDILVWSAEREWV